jgi:hypothetical protein
MRLIHSVVRAAGVAVTLAGLAVAAPAATAAGAAAGVGPTTLGVNPSSAIPGAAVTFMIMCGESSGSATLAGTVLRLPAQIPMTRQATAGEWTASVTLPSSLLPGTYLPSLECGNGVSGTTTLIVLPSGAPVTGDGTTVTAGDGQLTGAGLALAGLGTLVVALWTWRGRVRSRAGG